jgi:hypothetical protein
MTGRATIKYREFWDVPRIFFVENDERLYLFDCRFDETLDDYPDSYQVFLMPPLTDAELAGSWADLWRRAVKKVGDVPIPSVRFDPTKRAAIDVDVFDLIRPSAAPVNGPPTHAQPQSPVS